MNLMTYAILKYVYSVGISLSSQRTQGDIFWHRGQRELGITRQEIQDLLRNPEQIIHGDISERLLLKPEGRTVCSVRRLWTFLVIERF